MPRHSTAGGAGPSQRQLRVAELIRRALSDVFARGDLHDPGLAGASITVGEVRTSPDLRHATVFVLPLGGAGAEALIGTLNRNRAELRRAVTRSVDLKFSPELRFEVDTTFDQMDATRRMLADPRVTRDLDRDDDDDEDADRRDEEE
ncbi:30S ribosome-binding factor RbfA [Halovulum dunhuangense]|uniref:Ribosome-binding factor A n=1 Tax=Halovulum dunhuangense TaxID=1505036 RepID=A0A849L5U1_9RHOB|nr:30S ribosome-binding factor RbfA [Halovulum dunhuangense]NNU81623.1 30S ribosome-binding factor RbfA [Halovulum dunhuangense]